MLFPNPSRFFEPKKRGSFQVPTPILTDGIQIPYDIGGKLVTPNGEFPRRVELGEPLILYEGIKILSPVEGIASIDPHKKRVKIHIDGKLNPKPEYVLKEFSFSELQEKLFHLGVVSLDWQVALPIHKLLQIYKDSENSIIVFSPFTENNFINFQNKILDKHRSEFQTLVENLKKIFPKSKIYNYLVDSKNFREYFYPEGNPNFFLSKYCEEPFNSKVNFERVLYLGSETVYYIILALYYSLPFIERLVSVHVVNKNGLLEGEPKVFKIKNGTNLTTFFGMIREKYGYKYFTLNSFFVKYPVYEIGAEFIFDVYNHWAFIICENIILEHREKICIDCNDCNYFCPVSANPRELLNRNKSLFLIKKCIECGLCSVLCPSHIDFVRRIKEFKEESQLAIP